MSEYTPPLSAVRRVSSHLEAFADKEKCWEWPLSRTVAGYGQLGCSEGSVESRSNHYAHRVSYFIKNGPIPNGMFVCHSCDNPGCFNPSHLWLGTQKDNVHDCIQKGRSQCKNKRALGEKHWTKDPDKKSKISGCQSYQSKLTKDQVLLIRASKETGVALAKRFNVTASAISYVRTRKTYCDI